LPGTPITCEDNGIVCDGAEFCSPATGTCVSETPDNCCVSDSECSDGIFCNGVETCVNGDCVAGVSQCENCLFEEQYLALLDDIAVLGNAVTSSEERGHFWGGIVRLAAHDFMDFDQNAPQETIGGSDGCVDFAAADNAGLERVWCDDGCPIKDLYDTSYSFMSRADFWVAAANAAIKASSPTGLQLPFRWGRIDRELCPESSSRLPAPSGCSQIQSTFIDRMGLTWTDAAALMGAHTLGGGSLQNSGHQEIWMDTNAESAVFDKRFYEEIFRRSWFPRENTNAGTDWTWGGANREVESMMLHTDICLVFDIPDGDTQDCCTDASGNCRGFETQCPFADIVRSEAFNAVETFLGGGLNSNDNGPFYDGFSVAWEKATENGAADLSDVSAKCPGEPTDSPTTSPSLSPTSTAPLCADVETFLDRDGRTRDCAWVLKNGKCGKFGDVECPVSCNKCPQGTVGCLNDGTCTHHIQCCSGMCTGRGLCESVENS